MPKPGDTVPIEAVFIDSGGALKTGLTPTVRVRRTSDSKFLKNDATWTASPSTEYTMSAVDGTNLPGLYRFALAIPLTDAVGTEYQVRCDGTSTAANRYQHLTIKTESNTLSDLARIYAAAAGKQVQELNGANKGRITFYDRDGSTVLFYLVVTEDLESSPATRTFTPEEP